MNEIVGTIYYVLANDHNSEWANHAEADTYFLFHSIMMEMRDVFVPDMDATHTGIQGRISNLQNLLKTHDPEVYEHLQEYGIDASFFAIRWLTTLLSREFLLPDTIRLWDSMFASTHKENFLRYVCGTMVLLVREDLLKADFGQCLRLLQSYPPQDVDSILESSRSLWIYESQITMACHKGGISLHQALQAVTPPPTIIMAFGMRGGVAPRISLPFATDAAQQVVTSASASSSNSNNNNNNDGLLGKAKRLWGGWQLQNNKSNDSAENSATGETTTAKTTEASAAPPATTVPISRFWNRGRAETFEDNNNNKIIQDTSNKKNEHDAVNDTNNNINASSKPIRRPIWNRGTSDQDADTATTMATMDSSTTNTTTTTRWPIWGL